jgi:hypothetical protein
MTEIDDKSLLKCTIKKSADVLKKVLLYGLYVVIISILIIAMVAGGYLVWLGFNSSLSTVIYSSIISVLFSIPWYVYVGAMAVLAIPVYSLVWCIARELTDEDWKSEIAKIIALALAFFLALTILAIAFITLLALAFTLFAFFLAAFIAPLTIPLAFFLNSKIFLFIGAYLHYRKRMKLLKEAEKKE